MRYEDLERAVFVARPNRFIAHVMPQQEQDILPGSIVGVDPSGRLIAAAHVKNTGRCKELLPQGASVYIENHAGRMGSRKLQYSLIAVEKVTPRGILQINMDSQAPNRLAKEGFEEGVIRLEGLGPLQIIRPETTHGDSRFDLFLQDTQGRKAFVEVKGVTLEENGIAAFPDAPTQRGIKHIEGLIRAKEEGYEAAILFIVQMEGMRGLVPNDRTQPAFGNALRRAKAAGVQILAYECHVAPPQISVAGSIPVLLEGDLLWN
ncbi:MAG: DNA/RNA nuclease SfsA [Firmicutes bacterium]|nr:DNA/RNA nuclease SfsA [Bacillota bacterium]